MNALNNDPAENGKVNPENAVENDRRAFLKKAGKFAVYTPPAMTLSRAAVRAFQLAPPSQVLSIKAWLAH